MKSIIGGKPEIFWILNQDGKLEENGTELTYGTLPSPEDSFNFLWNSSYDCPGLAPQLYIPKVSSSQSKNIIHILKWTLGPVKPFKNDYAVHFPLNR